LAKGPPSLLGATCDLTGWFVRLPDSGIAGLKYRRIRATRVPPTRSALPRFDAITYFAVGGFALFFGLFFLVFLWDVPLFLYLCGPITFIPGVISIALGVMQWRREQAVIEFSNWLKSQRRIKMDVMAERIGKTRFETEKLLGEALDGGLVKGVIDRSADEFVVQERETGQEHFVGACPNCGGNVDAWYFPEERVSCPYCERVVTLPSAA